MAAGFSAFWYLGYHTLFWLDLYLTGAEEGFMPPAPFDLVEMESDELLPRPYTRVELLGYLEQCRRNCQVTSLLADGWRGKIAYAPLRGCRHTNTPVSLLTRKSPCSAMCWRSRSVSAAATSAQVMPAGSSASYRCRVVAR